MEADLTEVIIKVLGPVGPDITEHRIKGGEDRVSRCADTRGPGEEGESARILGRNSQRHFKEIRDTYGHGRQGESLKKYSGHQCQR